MTNLPHRLPFWNPTATVCERSDLLGGILNRAKVRLDGVGDMLYSVWQMVLKAFIHGSRRR